ncbi:MAG: metallophosphoesterase [Clostridia bacterium]|nr:metallophosphoesterase [Clostridia bacterium]
MKTKKFAKALLSVVLVVTMLLSMCIVGYVGVSAVGTELNYEFAYKNAGYAEGRITLTGGTGNYFIYWADDTKALDGYHEITVISSDDILPFEMDANTAIPAGATKVIAIQSDTIPEDKTVAAADAVFDIPADKQFKGGTKQYDFMTLSDIHIDYNNWYTYAKEHLANSLEVAAKRDVEFIATCGDTMNGNSGIDKYDDEWKTYLQILAASNYNNPIYEANGNHESYYDDGKTSDPYDFGLNLFKASTGLNAITGAVQSAPYFEKTINGDHHIFMAMELISKEQSPGASNTFTEAQINWLEGLFKKYENDGHRIFIYEHAPFKGYGAGDNKQTPYYGASMVDSYPQVKKLKNLLEAHKDTVIFSGHTHIDLRYGYNFDNENGKTAYTVHIPSNASTTHPNASGGLDYIHNINSSQGYLVDVYDKYVILNGTDLAFNAIYPQYSYMVDYSGEKLEKNELEDIVYETTDVTVDVSKLTSNASKVLCVPFDSKNNTAEAVEMTKNADGTFSADIIKAYAKFNFVIYIGDEVLKSSTFDNADCKVILGYQTLTYTPDNAVSFVRAHVWGEGDGTIWPGITMAKGASGSYSVKIPASKFTGVVFNWGDGDANKTSDIDISAGSVPEKGVELIAGADDIYVNLSEGETEPVVKPTTTSTQPVETTPAVTTKPAETEPSEVTVPTETTVVTEPTETTSATEPVKDELAPIVIIEKTENNNLSVDAYAADGAEDVQYKFSVNGTVYQDYSDKAEFVFNAPVDYTYTVEVSAKYADGTEHKASVVFEVKNGEAILPEMPERPVAPTTAEPTETTTEAKETTLPTTETTPTTVPAVEYMYGDSDLNGKINIKDATTVQKYAAKLAELDDTAFVQADVTGDMKVNVKDATAIQKYVAKIITVFPVEEGTAQLAAVGANATLMNEVKGVLSKEYQYASYDAYMALKKAYMNNVSDDVLNEVYADYKKMKSNNPIASFGGTVTIGVINIGNTGKGTPLHINISGGSNDDVQEGTPSSYYLRGSLTDWDPGRVMMLNSDGSASTKLTLSAGTYEFKVYDSNTSKWYGNTGTIEDTETGWTFTDTGMVNCTLNATGGEYTFKCYVNAEGKFKVDVTK